MNINFKTKEEYMTFRNEWKEEYKKVSTTIRNLRYMAKEESRACNIAQPLNRYGSFPQYYDKIKEILGKNDHYQKLLKWSNDSSYKSYYVKKYTAIATEMLENLKQAKVESQKQYLLHKNI